MEDLVLYYFFKEYISIDYNKAHALNGKNLFLHL